MPRSGQISNKRRTQDTLPLRAALQGLITLWRWSSTRLGSKEEVATYGFDEVTLPAEIPNILYSS